MACHFQINNIMPTSQGYCCQRDFQPQSQLAGCLGIYWRFCYPDLKREFPSHLCGQHKIKIWWCEIRGRGGRVQAGQPRKTKKQNWRRLWQKKHHKRLSNLVENIYSYDSSFIKQSVWFKEMNLLHDAKRHEHTVWARIHKRAYAPTHMSTYHMTHSHFKA